MAARDGIVFLFDVDETLFDNDRFKADLGRKIEDDFGPAAAAHFWALYEEERTRLGYADFLGSLQRFRLEHMGDPRAASLANWVFAYPFADRLFPGALAAVQHASRSGTPVILTDGDGVFQPYKIERAGLWSAFDGRVLAYIHKEKELAAVQLAYPAQHYVVIDDKPAILGAVKRAWGGHVTTVFVRQGHYAAGLMPNIAPDIVLDRIGELVAHEFSACAPV